MVALNMLPSPVLMSLPHAAAEPPSLSKTRLYPAAEIFTEKLYATQDAVVGTDDRYGQRLSTGQFVERRQYCRPQLSHRSTPLGADRTGHYSHHRYRAVGQC